MGSRLQAPNLLVDAEFSDVDQMCAAMRSWDLDLRPLASAGGGDPIGRVTQWRCGAIEFAHVRCRASLDQHGAPPAGRLTFVVPGAGLRRLWWRGHDVGGQAVLIFPLGSELRSLSGSDFDVHTVSVDVQTVGNLAERCGLALPGPHRHTEVLRPPRDLLDALRSDLGRLRDHPSAKSPCEARDIAEGLVLAWLSSVDDRTRRMAPLRARERALRRCLEAVEAAGYSDDLSSSQLCQLANVSERTLQYAFRERFGISPAAFLKARRLAAARRALLVAHVADTTVADTAAKFGFWHLSQFGADYRRAFGETPSATLGRPPAL